MKKVPLLIICSLIIFSPFFSHAQNYRQKTIDSLLVLIKKDASDDTLKVNLYNKLADAYLNFKSDTGMDYAKKGIQISEKIGYKRGLADNYNYLAVCFEDKSDFKSAMEYYFKALKYYEDMNDESRASVVKSNLGDVFKTLGNFDKSLEYHNKALKYYENINNKKKIANSLGNIGNVYLDIGNYKKAVEYYDKSYKINININNDKGIRRDLQNLAAAYIFLGNYEKAIQILNKCLADYIRINSRLEMMSIYGNIGGLYILMATDSSQKSKISSEQRKYYLNLGIENTQLALQISKEKSSLLEMHFWYENISDAYKELGNWKNTYLYADSSHRMKDSVNKKDNMIAIAKLEEKRETQLKQKENEILTKDNIIQKEARAKQVTIIYSTIAGLIMLVILAFVLYSRYRSKQKMNVILTDKNERIEKANIEIAAEREKSEKLLLNILPVSIADRLKSGESTIADYFEEASVMFIDLSGFTKYSSKTAPDKIVNMLNDIFVKFDNISAKYGIEKIKTIGDCYMAASGIPVPTADHAERIANAAMEIKKLMDDFITAEGDEIKVRIGLHCGPVVAGVIGKQKFIYDLWGDTVNTSSRMESTGSECKIQISERFKNAVNNCPEFTFNPRGEINVKGKGTMATYFMESA